MKASQLRSKVDADKPYYKLINKKKSRNEVMKQQVNNFYEDLNKKFNNGPK